MDFRGGGGVRDPFAVEKKTMAWRLGLEGHDVDVDGGT